MLHLETRTLRLSLDPSQAAWSLSHLIHPDYAFSQACLCLRYHLGRQQRIDLNTWSGYTVHGPESFATPLGNSQALRLASPTASSGLSIEVVFALPESVPCLLWKIKFQNQHSEPFNIEQIELIAGHPGTTIQFGAENPPALNDLAFFSNGWQSWSYTGAYGAQDRYQRTRLSLLHAPMQANAGTPQPRQRGHFASDMFGVLGSRSSRRAWLAGFLSQMQQFGSLEACLKDTPPGLRLWANADNTRQDPGMSMETDWACLFPIHIDEPDPLGAYVHAVALAHGYPGPAHSPLSGWCSWYHYYQKVQEGDVLENLHTAQALRAQLPIDLIQLDDGFERAVGDWLSFSPNFPKGVAPLASQIEAGGFTPGLWLAPFIVDPRSQLAHAHPDWLLRGQLNRPVNAGYTFWGTFATALDLTHPEALAYAAQVTHTAVHEWGYPFLKLDFLYAAALPGRHRDPTRTRAQVLRSGLQALRQAAGEKAFLLGCGCPLGSAIGLVDGMRISSDVSEQWEPNFSGIHTFFRHEPDFPSARNATHNSLTRAFMHQRWWLNDPDVVLPDPDLPLSEAEFETLATVTALTGGLLLVSGQLSKIPANRQKQWSALLPLINQRPRLMDWMDAQTPRRLRFDLQNGSGPWHLLAYFNWDDIPETIAFDLTEFSLPGVQHAIAREFWTGQILPLTADQNPLITMPAHGVRLFALRGLQVGAPTYLGSDLHISQGMEVAQWQVVEAGQQHTLHIRLERPAYSYGCVDLYLPTPPNHALLNDLQLEWTQPAADTYRFTVNIDRTAGLRIQYSPTA